MSINSTSQGYVNRPFKSCKIDAKVSVQDDETGRSTVNSGAGKCAPLPRTLKRSIPSGDPDRESKRSSGITKLFTLTYRKVSNKKKKTWDGDGYAAYPVGGNSITLYNELGKTIGSNLWHNNRDMFDILFSCGSLECQLDYEIIDPQEYEIALQIVKSSKSSNKFPQFKQSATSIKSAQKGPMNRMQLSKLFTPTTSTKFKPVIKAPAAATSLTRTIISKAGMRFQPAFDKTMINNPLVMNMAMDDEVEVIVDPLLSKALRPHQRSGVKFMYDCIRGLAHPEEDDDNKALILDQDSDIRGCLLADEMGLGKTFMTITLIWTLLKQNPKPSTGAFSQNGVALQGVCHKVIVVCPVTLIGNWKKEFIKWLPLNKIGLLTLSNSNTPDKDRSDVRNFLRVQRTYQVLIIGYEKLLTVASELEKGKNKLDLLVCDEGHRLKNSSSKILKCLSDLEIQRKVILTGTPIQNDLIEFYTIINFINPGILGSISTFKREYINPITRARDVKTKFNELIRAQGESKSQDLIEITKKFILRRTSSIISNYLPPKMDLVIFCRPTELQLDAFHKILSGDHLNFQQLGFNSSLGLITLLKKICNSPNLITGDLYFQNNFKDQNSLTNISRSVNSGKLMVLISLLEHIQSDCDGEKVIIISNYTQTLDIIQGLLISQNMTFVRLDGSTPSKERDSLVNIFNKSPSVFGFLLSAKSGGVGLNLIGASRLILFDNDWNPSVDLQAMSRIHRDGQKKPCYIYRLVTTGCIDEKIFQRQLMKNNLSRKFLDDHSNQTSKDDLFERDELRDLFTIHTSTRSNTHELICSCEGLGKKFDEDDIIEEESSLKLTDGWMNANEVGAILENVAREEKESKETLMKKCLVGYKHIDPSKTGDIIDPIIGKVHLKLPDVITFAFVKTDRNK
ncbi:HGR051Cp [Eremothecium sinecaudum]|uniref:DNA repair and recombination protein RDH54 n=1 Tax=Eremothecium sinecaudum TaxID=45286 RepID=A0A0X8HVS6_9SACH|nr:HGR051Cp [Eremothecium sinecaudum]AMD22390.1 HGR051Cp [Eremothecium sinecaudum]